MEKKNKRHFLDNELRKHRISSSMKRKWRNMRHDYLAESEGYDPVNDYIGQDIDTLEDRYMRLGDEICNHFLRIADRLGERFQCANEIKRFYNDTIRNKDEDNGDEADNNNRHKTITITPEQRERIFDVDKTEKDNEDNN